jgi:hypothetical protein
VQGSTVLKRTGLLKVHCLISIQARQVSRDNRDTQQRSCNVCQSNMSLEQATGRSIEAKPLLPSILFVGLRSACLVTQGLSVLQHGMSGLEQSECGFLFKILW